MSKRLTFPRRMFFLDNYDLAAFTPHNSHSAPLIALPTANAVRAKLAPVGLAHSARQVAWLIFFQVVGTPAAEDSSSRAGWQRSLLLCIFFCTCLWQTLVACAEVDKNVHVVCIAYSASRQIPCRGRHVRDAGRVCIRVWGNRLIGVSCQGPTRMMVQRISCPPHSACWALVPSKIWHVCRFMSHACYM